MKDNTEILLGYDEATYHKRPELSKTQLDQFLVSPLNYWYKSKREGAEPFPETSSMRIGSMVHKILLEGQEAFDEAYAGPPKDGVKKPTSAQLNAKKPSDKTLQQIEDWDRYIASCEGKLEVKPDELAIALKCVESVKQHPEAVKLLDAITDSEVTIVYPTHNGVMMRSRLDGVTQRGIVDVKTTRDATAKGFKSSVYKYNYGLQEFVYSWAYYQAYGRMPEYFIFLCVETSAPYHTALYTLPAGNSNYWAPIFEKALAEYSQCEKSGNWPGLNKDKLSELPIVY